MNKQEFQKSLTDKTLTIEEIAEVMKEAGYDLTEIKKEEPATPPVADASTPDIENILKTSIEAALAPLNKKLEDQAAQIEKLGSAPGGDPTKLKTEQDPPADDEGGEFAELKKFNKGIEEAAKTHSAIAIH